MENEVLLNILEDLDVDDVRHLKLEWYEGKYLKCLEYHQIKSLKEDK